MMGMLVVSMVMGLACTNVSLADNIEVPEEGSIQSGIGTFSGWKCFRFSALTVRFDGGNPLELPCGSQRNDTIGACGDLIMATCSFSTTTY